MHSDKIFQIAPKILLCCFSKTYKIMWKMQFGVLCCTMDHLYSQQVVQRICKHNTCKLLKRISHVHYSNVYEWNKCTLYCFDVSETTTKYKHFICMTLYRTSVTKLCIMYLFIIFMIDIIFVRLVTHLMTVKFKRDSSKVKINKIVNKNKFEF
jgi:hypothetical protein